MSLCKHPSTLWFFPGLSYQIQNACMLSFGTVSYVENITITRLTGKRDRHHLEVAAVLDLWVSSLVKFYEEFCFILIVRTTLNKQMKLL